MLLTLRVTQFFVTLNPAKYLNAKFVAFGKVVKGGEIFEEIAGKKCVNEKPVGTHFVKGGEQVV